LEEIEKRLEDMRVMAGLEREKEADITLVNKDKEV
jgi:hypothetical protein